MKVTAIGLILCYCTGCSQIKTQKDQDELSKLDGKYIDNLMSRQKIGIKQLNLKSDTLESVSDGKLTWRPFLRILSIESLQSLNSNIFSVESTSVLDSESSDQESISRLKYRNSFIQIRKVSKKSECKLVLARIQSKEIAIAAGIRIGMDRQDFFSRIFDGQNFGELDAINTFSNYDPLGEFIEQHFFFRADTLSEITMIGLDKM